MKLFRQLSNEEFESKIKEQNEGVNFEDARPFFFIMPPNQNKTIQLDETPYPELKKLISEYYDRQNNSPQFVTQVKEKLGELTDICCLKPDYEAYDLSSLKLRIAIDKSENLPECLVLGLLHLLIEEAKSDQNNTKFDFKVLIPQYYSKEQLTLYFNKDTPIADLIRLSQKVENYLKQEHHLPDNHNSDKARCYFNSFVSAFFDNNKVLQQYAKYPFFDIEFEEFFKKHQEENALEFIPLAAFDTVFYNVITSEEISLDLQSYARLKTKERLIVQKEFDQLIADPKGYIQASIDKIIAIEEENVSACRI